MSAMAKMLADMLLKELPPEVREALTPENMQRVAEGITSKWKFVEDALGAILAQQAEMIERLENIENVNSSGDKRRGKPRALPSPGSEPTAATGTDG